MKSLLSLFGLLGLAVVFGMSEPAPASTQPVTSDDVRLVSEQTSIEIGQKAGKNGNSGKRGKSNKRVDRTFRTRDTRSR